MTRRKAKILFLRFLSAAAALSFAYILLLAFYLAPSDEAGGPPAGASAQALAQESLPARLIIPKIGVDAKIEEVGITKSGKMATPGNFMDVGLYKYGTVPGNLGSAVIAGHVNNGVALPAVFADLKELELGDKISVLAESGEELRFEVIGSRIYDFNAEADEVFTEDAKKFLKLITCVGTWRKELGTHDKRLVVTAELRE